MNSQSFSRPCQSSVRRIAAVSLIMLSMLAWGSPAFCGPIHDAAQAGDVAEVKALLKANPGLISSKDNFNGMTPLHWAAVTGHMDVAELLLANKAEVNARDNFGETPLHFAASDGSRAVATLLLAHGASVNAETNDGWTPLHEAAIGNHKEMAELLLNNKAQVDVKNGGGYTPLHFAAIDARPDVAELLLAHGAEVNAKDNKGETPLRVAKGSALQALVDKATPSQNRYNMVELLRQHGGHE